MRLARLAWLSAISMLVSGRVLADPPFEMDKLETNDLRLLYTEPESYLSPHVARSFENSMKFQRLIFDWTPWDKTTIVLTDLSDYGNAGASASPRNAVSVFIAPDSLTLETSPGSERMFMLFNHELVHVATMDGWNKNDRAWRVFFGGKPRQTDEHPETILYNYLTVPRLSSPRWYLEGSAVFMETWMSGGLGRAQGAYDEMVFRAMVRDNAHFFSPLGLVSEGTAVDFQTVSNAYLYGTRFMSYLALHYSPEQLIEWWKRKDGSDAYYSSQFEKVFGLPLNTAWNDWIAWEHEFQKANLEKVRQYPLTPARHLARQALGSVSKSFIDPESQTMIGAFRYPGVLAHVGVMSLKDGSIKRLTEIKGPMKYRVASTAYDPQNKTFFYTADNLDYRDLMAVDVRTGKTRMLLRDARIGDLAFDAADRSIWGLQHLNGYVSLVRIPYPYTNWTQVHTWPYGEIAFELDMSPDGKLLSASMDEIDGHRFLRIFRTDDLLAGKAEPMGQYDFGQATPEGFVFTADGRYLYGSSYYTGISNIYRYEIKSGDMEAVSNAETGFFRPMPQADGSLIVLEYTGQGFVPTVIDPVPLKDLSAITFLGTEIAEKHPVVKTWGAGSPAKIPLESMITNQGKYRPAHEMRLESDYPVIEGYRGSTALGWHVDFSDPLRLHSLGITAAASVGGSVPGNEKLHVSIDYKALNWYARYWHNYADFYDLFGPIETSRKGDAVIVGYKKALILDEPRRLDFSTSLAYYTGLDTLPGNQNVVSTFSEIFSAKAGLKYAYIRESQNSVDREQGFGWNLDAATYVAGGKTVPQLRGGFDFGFMLPLRHSSIWLYNSAGVSGGDRSNSLASFYFGGFHNNYVDNHDAKRYREYDSFPGFGIDEINGQSFVKSTLEWNLPPIRFEEVGKPGAYLSWMRPALFAGVLVTDPNNSAFRRTATDLGGQLDFNFTILNRLPMTLSIGYAAGFEHWRKVDDEWMLSLKIL
jgi:hypothetical protein